MYYGEWKHGKRDGYGTYSVLLPETKEYVTKYCGGWKNGKKHVCLICHAKVLLKVLNDHRYLFLSLFINKKKQVIQEISEQNSFCRQK